MSVSSTHLSATFSIQNDMKQGATLSPLLLDFDLEEVIREAQENMIELKLNRISGLLVYDGVNLLAYNKYRKE